MIPQIHFQLSNALKDHKYQHVGIFYTLDRMNQVLDDFHSKDQEFKGWRK